ncbi:hypothetical protein AVEN_61883-1 [Araneus ventricosus]|uniref:Uncharacterized protein n=1 Tax=Araneus ventricosus TaxID=182803 RepID=A0A4Y2SRX0_ARAVE|nr:hypothetical protein AVEN_61883-1 [Araneus ventricosus]
MTQGVRLSLLPRRVTPFLFGKILLSGRAFLDRDVNAPNHFRIEKVTHLVPFRRASSVSEKSRHRKTSTLSPSEAQQLNGLFLRLSCWNARLIHNGRSRRDAETVLAVDNSQKKNVCRHL